MEKRIFERINPGANLPDIRKLPTDKLSSWLESQGERSFRARQIEEWLWKKSAKSFADMTTLPLKIRSLLHENYAIYLIATASDKKSNDGTTKAAQRISAGNLVEEVLIPATNR